MRIAIDVSPLESGHKIRGVGFYLKNLKDSLETYFPTNTYTYFTGKLPGGVFDVIHYPYFDPFFVSLPFFHSYPVVVTVHDLTPIIFPSEFPAGVRGSLKWRMNKFLLSKADIIITDSDSSTKDVSKFVRIASSKVKTVTLAAGKEFHPLKKVSPLFKNLQKKYDLPEKFVMYVGDVTWNKNLPRLCKAVIDSNVPLVMVGKAITDKDFDEANPWNKDRVLMHNLIKNNSLFFPVGFISTEDLNILYNKASALVMPSLYEGFGLPVAEAMQSGCPVITSREGSLSEVGGEAVLYVDAYSQDSISAGIKKVFNLESLQHDLSKKGIVQSKKFSWKITAEKTLKAYELALKEA
ncbi:MAG: glycosyltransferase family 4 protein [Candidatus Levybacteria bacterium]|nr:glycosyltransferase family 4 protein [Candidatus Levybacteria bacterium]